MLISSSLNCCIKRDRFCPAGSERICSTSGNRGSGLFWSALRLSESSPPMDVQETGAVSYLDDFELKTNLKNCALKLTDTNFCILFMS